MFWVRRLAILLALVLCFSFIAWITPQILDPTHKGPEKRDRDRRWVNSSPYWWDRQACRWISVCGLHHLRKDPATRGNGDWGDDVWGDLRKREVPAEPRAWEEGGPQPKVDKKRDTHERRRILKDIPDYVFQHAPLVHLYSGEEFWPSDIREHVEHMTPFVDDEELNATDPWTLHNLHELNKQHGKLILASNDDVETRPNWLHSHYNIPSPFDGDGDDEERPPKLPPHSDGRKLIVPNEPTTWFDVDKDHPLHRISDPRQRKFNRQGGRFKSQPKPKLHPRGHKPDADGYSTAPAVLVVVDKGSGVVDAFWFFFYSYNLGQTVLGIRFGNHVGDWEHTMIRFENGEPRGIFFSEHEGGQAYAWEAVEKRGVRPVLYSAVGSHAMYALPGSHPYILPFRLLKDVTDKGPLWDPALNNYAYHYDYTAEYLEDVGLLRDPATRITEDPRSLVPAAKNPEAPTSWFHYDGRWGDEVYSLADPRQWRLFGQYHYVTGPDGPKFKTLARNKVCPAKKCKILYELDPKGTWY